MADKYVYSGAAGSNNGTSWANAWTSIASAFSGLSAGDTLYIASDHSQTFSAANMTLNGANNVVMVSADRTSGEPPATYAAGASLTTSGSFSIAAIQGAASARAYYRGLNFTANTSDSGVPRALQVTSTNNWSSVVLEDVLLEMASANANSRIVLAGSTTNNGSRVELANCTLKFGHASQCASLGGQSVVIRGGSISGSGSAPTTVFDARSTAVNGRHLIEGFDFSNAAAGAYLCAAGAYDVVIRNCKLPASWTGDLCNGSPSAPYCRLEMYNCDSGDTNYRIKIKDYSGTLTEETVVIRTGGASDGTTGLAWKLVSTANTRFACNQFVTPEIVVWNDTTGSSKTVTVEVVTDNVTLKDDECWLEIMYLGTSGVPLGSWITDAKADVLATAANQDTSSETWTTTGLTTPVKQKLSVTFTPQEKGFIHARVVLAKPSATVYVDPKLELS